MLVFSFLFSISLFKSQIVAFYTLHLNIRVPKITWKYINQYQRLWEVLFLYSKYTFDFSCDKLLSDKFVFFNIDVSVWQTEKSQSRKYLPAYYSGMFRPVHAVFNS